MPYREMHARFAHLQQQHDDTQRQQDGVVVDPTGATGDPSNDYAVFAYGDLADFGIAAYGAAAWNQTTSSWVLLPGAGGGGGGGGYASLTGPGQTTTPGDLTQAGGFEIDAGGSGRIMGFYDATALPGIAGNIGLFSASAGGSGAGLLFDSPNPGDGALWGVDQVDVHAGGTWATNGGPYLHLIHSPGLGIAYAAILAGAAVKSGVASAPQPVLITTGDPLQSPAATGPYLRLDPGTAGVSLNGLNRDVAIAGNNTLIQPSANLGFFGAAGATQGSAAAMTTLAALVTYLQSLGLLGP
jgi:hypothetical protein